MSNRFWSVPRSWPGETVVCVGGGPSLTQEEIEFCRGKARVIVINDGYRLAPWADVLYFCDRRWFEWHKDEPAFRSFPGTKVTLDEWVGRHGHVNCLKNTGRDGLESKPYGVRTGRNGGYQAINLAVHFGARLIVLIGYDMRHVDGRSHWHGGHPVTAKETVYRNAMMPCFPSLVEPLATLGVHVINATPGSALTVFPSALLREALCDEPLC